DGETKATRDLYGLDAEDEHTRTFAMQCLVARRLVERGVRFIDNARDIGKYFADRYGAPFPRGA
ncbi:MAG: DUF1501 domain-containing protein, partial [Pseudomonadota bacterium]